MATVYPPAVANLIDEFRAEALCREEASQQKANKIWRELRPLLKETEIKDIAYAWVHHKSGSTDNSRFEDCLKRITKNYRII